MAEFLRLLAFYYMCDAAASERALTLGEFEACMASYDAVKAHFAPQDLPDSPARTRAAYAGFKAWEAENAALVAELKEAARSRI